MGVDFSAGQFQHVSEIPLSPRFWNDEEGPKFKKSGSPIGSAHSCPHLSQSYFLHMQDPVFLKRSLVQEGRWHPHEHCRCMPTLPTTSSTSRKNPFQRIFSEHCETGYWKRQSPTCLPRCSIAVPPSAVRRRNAGDSAYLPCNAGFNTKSGHPTGFMFLTMAFGLLTT